MLTCGVDIGASTIDIVLFNGTQIVATIVTETGAFPQKNAQQAFDRILQQANLSPAKIDQIVATGYGRNYFAQAQRAATEILCHARGVAFLFPSARTVIDIGGQDSKMIEIGPGGKVLNFVMNDRCAAGTGKFVEMVARTLSIPLETTGQAVQGITEICEISSMCAVFAESEIIGLLHKGVPREVILRGVFRSIARRTLGMAGKIGLHADIVFTGGVARNTGVCQALQEEIGDRKIIVPPMPQVTGALGAAIIGMEDLKNR
ncbi:MAG: acyl-CoA dehydratase activase [candidate division KSB1 bacterium]|nr:acyl-CoA dehydratase activase [candidate division KSB1 bacterium]MDZ7317892.1 acyl-CoA dehydratase activase [candidate division KSB1 bacterium]MDZ7341736.1 acyl-CoA dehydratase activase [candidate division KSB1 bacterium]